MIPIAKPIITETEKENVLEVMDSGILAMGEYVSRFEKNFCSFLGTEQGIATVNGTSALHVALKAAGIKKDDRVLTTPFTFIGSTNAILYCDAQPVFVDVCPDTFNIDPDLIAARLRKDPGIKALLIVHLYGLSCDMEKIKELVTDYNLILIEDCAQAHGAEYKGQKVGNFGDVGVFSFYPTKNITASEGGMVVTGNQKIAEKCRLLINHGSVNPYQHEIMGYNYRMTNIEAAIGLAQLEKIEKFNQARKENARFLSENLGKLDWLETPCYQEEFEHVFHLYTVKVKYREKLAHYLQQHQIGYGIYYPLAVYQQPLYQRMGYGNLNLPVTEKLTKQVISLPVHPALSKNDLEKIVEVVANFSG